jgi:hypothetical protein
MDAVDELHRQVAFLHHSPRGSKGAGTEIILGGMTTLDTAQLHALVPLAATLGMRLSDATPAAVRLEMDWRAELCTAGGAPSTEER